MENEHRIPEEATRPQPKRTSFRRAAMMAAGLALGGEGAVAEPTGSPETRTTTEVSQAVPDKAKESKEKLHARLESITWVTGITSDIAYTKPDNLYTNKFTPEFIEWLLARGFANEVLQCNPTTDSFHFTTVFMTFELLFQRETGQVAYRQQKMTPEDAKRHIQFLKDAEFSREP